MNKQWDELRSQANLRGQRIDDTMFRWSNFSEKVKELCDWIDKMEVKVISSKDYHIEDLLNKMQKVRFNPYLTLYLIEMPFNAFANRAYLDQAALVRAA